MKLRLISRPQRNWMGWDCVSQEELDQTRQELAESQRFASELQRSAQQRRRSSDSSSHSDEHRAEESNGGDGGDATPGLHAPVLLGEHANVVPCAHVVASAQLEPRTPRPDPVTVDATVNTPRPVKNKSQRKSQARRGHKTAQAGVAAAGNAENDGRACNSSRACQREQRPRSAASKAPGRLVPVARVLQPRFTVSIEQDAAAFLTCFAIALRRQRPPSRRVMTHRCVACRHALS
eukprot:6188819-Pleurochrysis_carterae.AAC.3